MEIKIKIKPLPTEYKGHDIMFLKGGKEYAKIVLENGERQAHFYCYPPISNVTIGVELYLFANEQYFIVQANGKIKHCIYV